AARSVAVRKPATHPSTAVMVREALKALDSRKGVSSQAIQNYIKQKYSTVEPVRLKHLVRRILKNGLLNGTLIRPVNATVTTGALGKFRLAPKIKEVKLKSENTDPNVEKPKAGAKKTQTEKKKPTNKKAKSTKNPKPPKATKDEAAAPSKVPPAKKPKAKKVEATGSTAGSSEPTKNKTAKAKVAKTEKKTQSKAVKSGSDAPASKTAGKRVKK
uniref:Linker histone H1M n=1 Tax=Poecilia reticulata TaxID=8081 RepID=A0A3P9NFZ8_POERE